MSSQARLPPRNPRLLDVTLLTELISQGGVDTVIVAFTDMQGRLQGKRVHGEFFLDHVLGHGTEACDYLLAVDVDMNTVGGYAISSWDSGYGDMILAPDVDTIRLLPHQPGTAMVQCDVTRSDGTAIAPAPRRVLAEQVRRIDDAGYVALAGTELEFLVFQDSYERAWDSGYAGLTPENRHNVDYSVLGGTRVEPLLREIRRSMHGAGMFVESAKGECHPGQHEIVFRYADVLTTADNHAVYRNSAKEIAARQGCSVTFMAKFDEQEGSSCHIHLSLRDPHGAPVFWDERTNTRTALYDSFLAGVLATLREFTLLYAPNINSYKRFAAGSFAPTTVTWGLDNRTCAIRLVGQGGSARLENRVPGSDVNQYLALAAVLAGGLHGVANELSPPAECRGNAYQADAERLPRTLREARDAFAGSPVAAAAFGADVVGHYVNAADVELAAFESAITDWERYRGFERL